MINAIFAVDQYGGMGYNGSLPWPHNAEDLTRFQRMTTNHIVVMGSRTWNDPKMPKPLKGRTVYVASSKPVYYGQQINGDIVSAVLDIERQNPDKTVWIIGGPQLLIDCNNILENVYLTHFKGSFKIDTKIDVRKFLLGFVPTRAEVSNDRLSTFVKYSSVFKRRA